MGEEGTDRARIEPADVAEVGGVTEAMGEPGAELAPVARVGLDRQLAGVALVTEVVAPALERCIEVGRKRGLAGIVHGLDPPNRLLSGGPLRLTKS